MQLNYRTVLTHLFKNLLKGSIVESLLKWVGAEGQDGTIIGLGAWLLHEEVFALLEKSMKCGNGFLDVSDTLIFRSFLADDSVPGPNCHVMCGDELLVCREDSLAQCLFGGHKLQHA